MTMPMEKSDVLVLLDHPFGRLEVPLAEWIERGPGPRRGLRPIGAKSLSGRTLPLSVIPFRYRNSTFSRTLIGLGFLADPWPPAGEKLQVWTHSLLASDRIPSCPESGVSMEEAIEICRRVSNEEGWPMLGVVEAKIVGDTWEVLSNADHRGCYARITVQRQTGQVLEKAFAPR